MARRGGTITGFAALLLGAMLVATCSAQPTSQAVESTGPVATGPAAATPSATPSEAAVSAEASPAVTPGATVKPAPGIPGKPAKVTFTEIAREPARGGQTRVTYRLAWSATDGVATSFTVVGLTACLREGKAFDEKPCLVKGMRIPKRVQEVLARVPGSEHSVDIAWKLSEIGPGPYFAVLIRASNDAGDSIFAIAWSDTVCWQCTY